MARQNEESEQERKEKREVALINLKGKLPILYFCQLMQSEDRPFGQDGLSLSHQLFIKYLDDSDIQSTIMDFLKNSEINSMKRGAGVYGGQVTSKDIITNGSAIINESINRVYVSDIADILGVKCSKFKDTYVGNLNERTASKEDKEVYKGIIMAYQSNVVGIGMSKAMEENSKVAKASLEKLLS